MQPATALVIVWMFAANARVVGTSGVVLLLAIAFVTSGNLWVQPLLEMRRRASA